MSFWDKLKPAAPAAPTAIHMDVTTDGKVLRLPSSQWRRSTFPSVVTSM